MTLKKLLKGSTIRVLTHHVSVLSPIFVKKLIDISIKVATGGVCQMECHHWIPE